MSVKAGAQSLLVKVVGNQTNAPTQDKETIQHAHAQVILDLLGGESAAVTHQVDEADGDAAVDVQDQIVLFGRGDRFDGDGVVEESRAGEVLLDVLLDQLDTQVRVVA